MIKLRMLIFLLVLSIFSNQYAQADSTPSWEKDDSCTEGMTILNKIVANITTLGLFTLYSNNFKMEGAPAPSLPDGAVAGDSPYKYYPTNKCNPNYYPNSGNNPIVHNPKNCAEGDATCKSTDLNGQDIRCNYKGGMQMCYEYVDGDLSLKWDCNWVNADGWGPKFYLLPIGTLKAMKNGDKICAYFDTALGYQAIGCKYIPDCSRFGLSDSCFVAQSCSNNASQQSRSFLPIAGSIVQCVKESIARLFFDTSACGDGSYTTSYFPVFQDRMRKAIRAALTLYLILFGLKIALGHDMPSKGEFFKMGAKYILVVYFSVGISTGYGVHNQPIYDDGVTTYMLPFFNNGSASLANMVYSSGGANGLCYYDPKDYASEYSYLSMWDSIDCRLMYYMGTNQSQTAGFIDSGAQTTEEGTATQTTKDSAMTLADFGSGILVGLLLPAFMSFQFIFLTFSMVFAIFVLSVTVYMVNITVISMILVAILVYLAPVFVPMALFEATKGFYDGWLKLLAAYALQPMVVAAYMALMLTIFDQTMFGDCTFSKASVLFNNGGTVRELPIFMLCDPDNPGAGCKTEVVQVENVTKCKETIGYYINPIKSGYSYTDTVIQLFFSITILNNTVVNHMLVGIITLTLFAYLFYKFAGMMGQFASEITGGGSALARNAGNPMAVVDKAMQAAIAVAKYYMGDTKGAAESAAKVATSDGDNEGKKRGGGNQI